MKNYMTLAFLFCFSIYLSGQDALNINLFAQFDRGDERYSGSWSYIDDEGNEYALLGAKTGLAIYSIDDTNIQELSFIPGPSSNWREITVVGDYAYVVTEGSGEGEGMQVVDLSNLPNSAQLVNTYTQNFNTGHIIQRNNYSDEPYVYVISTNVYIIDTSNPAAPQEVGVYDPDYYIHDAFIKGNLMYACAFSEGTIDVLDISDPSSPALITRITDLGGNTHSVWTSEDDQYLIVCDEEDGLPLQVYNIQDLEDVYQVATYSANEESLIHNPYIIGDYCYVTHNAEGLRILDIADPAFPVEVAYYDTYDGESSGFHGLWSACPFFPSGKIIGGNREDGLYVWTFNNVLANRIYVTVVDSISGIPITNANVFVSQTNENFQTDLEGKAKVGGLEETYTLTVSADNYNSKILDAFIFSDISGTSTNIIVELTDGDFVETTSSVNNIVDLFAFPNPFNQSTIIDLEKVENPHRFILIDNTGKEVRNQLILRPKKLEINRDQLPSGVYYFNVLNKSNEVIGSGKLIGL